LLSTADDYGIDLPPARQSDNCGVRVAYAFNYDNVDSQCRCLSQHLATLHDEGFSIPVAVLRDTDSSAVVDGGFHLSPFVHDLAAGLAREKALATGIAVVGVKNAGVSGALGVHA